MKTEQKAKAYDEALEKIQPLYEQAKKDDNPIWSTYEHLFPELRESEDEKRMRAIAVLEQQLHFWSYEGPADKTPPATKRKDLIEAIDVALSYLETQKELPISAEEVLARAGLKPYKDGNQWCILAGDNIQEGICGFGDTIEDALYEFLKAVLDLQKEQKPTSTEDMPYITDEHFYERELADSFKYKLAEYMTKCCTKKEGPYGYTYGISAEAILKMAEEELLKRGVVQKPAEWSEEDHLILDSIIAVVEEWEDTQSDKEKAYYGATTKSDWLKSLRPQPKAELTLLDENIIEAAVAFVEQNNQFNYWKGIDKHTVIKALCSLKSHWKPSAEQMEALKRYSPVRHPDVHLVSLYDDLKKLM